MTQAPGPRGRPAASKILRTEVRPIPNGLAISEWLTHSALSWSTSAAFSDAVRGRPWGRPSLRA
jgi:hypothetical protein